MKVLCFGNRLFADRLAIRRELSKLPGDTIVVHGANGRYEKGKLISGADMLCDEAAKKLGFEVRPYPADWSVGRSGGPIRNRYIISCEHPDKDGVPFQFALAFSAFFTKEFAPGTFDMMECCTTAGIKVCRYSE